MQHDVAVHCEELERPDRPWVGRCTCGWRTPPCDSPSVAQWANDKHIEAVNARRPVESRDMPHEMTEAATSASTKDDAAQRR